MVDASAFSRHLFLGVLALGVVFSGGPAHAQKLESKLVIQTSYPKDMTRTFKTAFEKRHPGTTVEVLSKGTSASVKYIQANRSNPPDLFWASAPDAFEVLKDDDLLQKYTVKTKGLPKKVGAFPVHDPDGYYKGFAASGYGIMYNLRYLKAKGLPAPKEWDDLRKPIYFGHVGMSAPSRSGTTHLTVETILQGKGWEKGWAAIKEMSGNFAAVTERSFGVPAAVNSGEFGIGIVIDFFGLSSQATGFPVEFVYPTVTTLVPANIAVISGAKHPKAAGAFIEFLLSVEGQEILLDPKIRRLPVNPKTYAKAPKGFPNPFKDKSIGAAVKFDLQKSKSRYNLINSLFDQTITFRLDDLTATTKAVQDAERALAKKPNAEAAKLLKEARALLHAVPITEAQSLDPKVAGVFKKKRKKMTVKVPKRQAEVEEQWDRFSKKNYVEARKLAGQALAMVK